MPADKNRKDYNLIFSVFLLIAGIGFLLYPTVSEAWNTKRARQLITQYETTAVEFDSGKYEEMLRQAQSYNEAHKYNTYLDASGNIQTEHSRKYDELLNPMNNGTMGYIDIPLIHLSIPIAHGLSAEVLENGAGHLEGTSLPVGGESTHCVLAGHRGLPSARLFTDLDQMKEGDLFYLHILQEVFAYEVTAVETVLPDETESLDIHRGKDEVTLVTCTPYAINTKRLLVTGARVELKEEEKAALAADTAEEDGEDFRLFLRILGIILIPVTFILILANYRPNKTGV